MFTRFGESEQAFASDLEESLGVQVRRLRIAAGYSQAELAAKAGISVSAIYGLERGKGATLTSFIKVLRALGNTQWLQTLSPDPNFSPIRFAEEMTAQEPQRVTRRGRHSKKLTPNS